MKVLINETLNEVKEMMKSKDMAISDTANYVERSFHKLGNDIGKLEEKSIDDIVITIDQNTFTDLVNLKHNALLEDSDGRMGLLPMEVVEFSLGGLRIDYARP